MKRKIMTAVLLVSVMLAGIAGGRENDRPPGFAPKAADSTVGGRFSGVNEWLGKNNLTLTDTLEQAFINRYVLVTGEGIPAPSARSAAQRRLTAERAATLMAYRQLTEFLEGVTVSGDTLVKDAELQYDIVRSTVHGFTKGMQIVYKEFNDQEGSAVVIVKVGMTGPSGFGSAIYEKMFGESDMKKITIGTPLAYHQQPVELAEKYDGLIIDAAEQAFRPALINRIFTTGREVIYDPSRVSQKVLVDQGCGEYTNTIGKAKAALETRGVKTPLIVKASGVVSSSDLQVADQDAVKIFSADQKTNFLASARVAFVLK